jgi:predicted AAA+ superfamily ATPase
LIFQGISPYTFTMIDRSEEKSRVLALIADNPVTALLGARQTGKSTLARDIEAAHYFDLENPRDLASLDQPQLALEGLQGLVVIDEIQRKPELFPLLRYLCDARPGRRFLVLGSASRDLIRQGSESLAGRISYHELRGFGLREVCSDGAGLRKRWLRGGFPRSWLAPDEARSLAWRRDFIQTFLERDIPQLGIRVPAATMGRFWTMLSHYHGQVLNYQELARSFGVSDATVRHYLEILEGSFMIRLLKPWHENVGKRLVKAPKLYIRDSGIFHALHDIGDERGLATSPKLGASWEGFVLEEIMGDPGTRAEAFSFYRTHAGAELDLFWSRGGKRIGVEVKYADAPRMTPSMRNALTDCRLDELFVVYPGDKPYALMEKVRVVPALQLHDIIEP